MNSSLPLPFFLLFPSVSSYWGVESISFLRWPKNLRKFKISNERANPHLTFISFYRNYKSFLTYVFWRGKKKTGFGKAIINSAGCGILVEKEQEYGIKTPHFTRPCYFIPPEFWRLMRFRGLRSLFFCSFVCFFFSLPRECGINI